MTCRSIYVTAASREEAITIGRALVERGWLPAQMSSTVSRPSFAGRARWKPIRRPRFL